MTVKKGDKIKVDYTGTLDDGTVFDTSIHEDHSHPLEFEAGAGQVIPGFDEAVIGMKVGEEKEISLPPEQAYGAHDPERKRAFPKDQMPEGAKEGMFVVLGTDSGQQVQAKILEITDKEVVIDMNPPLAGKTLNFKLKLVAIN